MVKKYLMNGVGVLALGLIVASCSRDTDFSPAEALEHAESVLGVKIDPNQDWKMTQSVTTHITVNKGTGKDYTVYVFDKNPFENEDAVYYTKQTVKDASILDVNLSVPSYLNSLYVSVFDSDDHSFSKNVAIVDEYVTTIFGNSMPDSYLTRSGRRANAGENYPATSTGINANANEWADPAKEFGGWVVPDPLTEDQKNVVTAYFQANPKLSFKDPEWRHFFVQQVYKGATSPGENSTEKNYAAGGTEYTSSNMNLLTVGQNEQHINNFNDGNCSMNSSVLDNGGNVNDGPYHSDQIMLMVNIDDTSCFGYHNTGMSLQRNDKAALVGWETIDTWAKTNYSGYNGCLKDKWNRSFMGFDFELFNLEESYAKNNGETIYAKMTDGQNAGLQYVWDGNNVISKGEEGVPDLDLTSQFNKVWNNSESIENNADGTITYHAAQWGGLVDEINNAIDFSTYKSLVVEFAEATPVKTQIYLEFGDGGGKWYDFKKEADAGVTKLELDFASNYLSNLNKIRQVALQAADAGDLKISKIYLKGEEGEEGFGNYLLVDGEKVPFLNANMNQYGGIKQEINDSDMKINKEGKDCFNMEKIKELVDSGYLPVKDKNLREWVKWQGGDKYYSDWIVTLCKAKRINDEGVDEHEEQINPKPAVYSYAFEDSWYADYDMNDVVVKVKANASDSSKIDVTLCCSGAAYNLYVFIRENGKDYPLFGGYEVHAALGGSAGKFINTGDSSNEKFEDGTPNTTTINWPKKFDKQSSDSVYVPLANLDIWIKSPEKDIHVAEPGEDPHGVVIPYDWKWPTEWTSIKTAYPDFVNFAKDQSESLDWYNNPATGSGLIYGE